MCFLMLQVIFTDVDYNFILKAEKFLDMRGNVDLKQNMRFTRETLKCVHLYIHFTNARSHINIQCRKFSLV